MKCARCGRDASSDETFSQKGQTLCEDCYIDVTSPEKECDPWATYLSKQEMQRAGVQSSTSLNETQRKIYELVLKKNRITREAVMKELGLSALDLEPNLRVLKHSELVREQAEGDGLYITPISGSS